MLTRFLHTGKMRLNSYLILYIKNNSKSTSNVKTIKLSEENKTKSHNLGFDSGFSEKPKKLEQQKNYKTDHCISSKLETCESRDIIEK